MKLATCDVIVTAPPAPRLGGRYWLFVKVTTACGITGWGECYAASVGPRGNAGRDCRCVCPPHGGHIPLRHRVDVPKSLFRWVYTAPGPDRDGGVFRAGDRLLGHHRQGPRSARAQAHWRHDKPAAARLHLSGTKTEQDADAFWVSLEMAAEAALERVEQGFTAVKFDPPPYIRPGHQPAMRDIERSVAFCDRLGTPWATRPTCSLARTAKPTAGAIRMAQGCAHQPLWFEEPIPPGQYRRNGTGGSRKPGARGLPGERLTTKAEFALLLRKGCPDPATRPGSGRWHRRSPQDCGPCRDA